MQLSMIPVFQKQGCDSQGIFPVAAAQSNYHENDHALALEIEQCATKHGFSLKLLMNWRICHFFPLSLKSIQVKSIREQG